jgi:hypothetical protein
MMYLSFGWTNMQKKCINNEQLMALLIEKVHIALICGHRSVTRSVELLSMSRFKVLVGFKRVMNKG